ncbi:hypothetical protein JTE90_007020 [Oedothorax gibbosus]|uniref:CCHC-type domain-containing protein n=1 Tax=Oedothorax gibbosus TaxID=931172 RepID=A0AAV6TFQ1_9ARAC|nr:hypothetical protein JTE90_007020 [Oedothorax gibbosus]
MATKRETRSEAKPEILLQKIKNSADYKKFNKSDNPRSCEVLEVWVGTLESDPDLVDTKDKVVDLLNWMSTIRDQRLGYGLQNLMTGLYLDPILDNLVNLKKKVAFLTGENDKLYAMNSQLRVENELNTSSEERQELRLLSAENAKLMDQNQELLFRVQTSESKENAMTEIKKDFETHLGKVTGPLVKAVNEKVAELKGLTDSIFAKITEQETKVLAQYKTFIGEVNSNRAVEKDLVKKIQDREKVLMDNFDKLVTSGIPEPPWVSSLMKLFTSAGDGSPRLVMEPPAEPAWASVLMSKVSALEEGHLAPSLQNDSPVGVAPKPTSLLSLGGDPYSGLEFIALMDKGDYTDFSGDFKKDLLTYCDTNDCSIKVIKFIKLKTGVKLIVNGQGDLGMLQDFIKGSRFSKCNHFTPRKLAPKLIIKFTNITSKEDLIKKLSVNGKVFLDERIKVLFNIPIKLKEGNKFHWVLEIPPQIYKEVKSLGEVFLDLDFCKILDFDSLRFCRKCLKYGHSKKFCKSPLNLCYRCGEEAHDGECDQTNCYNCKMKNKNMMIKTCEMHFAGTPKCPLWERELDILRERVDKG